MDTVTKPDPVTSSAKRRDAISPTPWRIDGQTIRDADGVVVMSALNPASMATRRLIVEAVNERDRLRNERDTLDEVASSLQRSRDAALADADRLRDLVRRLAEYIRLGYCNEVHIDYADRPNYHVRAADLLEEAREAIGEDAP